MGVDILEKDILAPTRYNVPAILVIHKYSNLQFPIINQSKKKSETPIL